MAICEKCWADAYLISKNTSETQLSVYLRLIEEHKDNPCTEHFNVEEGEEI